MPGNTQLVMAEPATGTQVSWTPVQDSFATLCPTLYEVQKLYMDHIFDVSLSDFCARKTHSTSTMKTINPRHPW